MARKVQQIRIESILGGHAPMTHFAAPGQFFSSNGVNPNLGEEDNSGSITGYPTGLLRPTPCSELTDSTNMNGEVMWMVSPPSGGYSPAPSLEGLNYFIYDYVGSIYTVDETFSNFTSLGDLNDGQSAKGNGCAYYDNYVYFATDTTIARYGPFTDTTQTFTDDYWVGTLGKVALENNVYPAIPDASSARYPNHVLHRHSDGRLYIADVVDNQGTLHYIETTKTTAEGDTDAGSTYDALNFGYKLFPTAMESYGESLVVALFENIGTSNSYSNARDARTTAKVAFWDTTSEKANQIVWVEYPDQIITAIRNVNGILYFFSGNIGIRGYRVMRYVGGNSFEEVFSQPNNVGSAPPAGAVDTASNFLAFASISITPTGQYGTVYALGINHRVYGNGIFSIHSTISGKTPTALKLIKNWSTYIDQPVVATNGIRLEVPSGYGNAINTFHSETYRLGQPYQILKIRIPLLTPLAAGMEFQVRAKNEGWDGNTETWTVNTTNYPVGSQSITIRPENLKGDNTFSLEFRWTGTTLCTISLPITIDYEFLDIDGVSSL